MKGKSGRLVGDVRRHVDGSPLSYISPLALSRVYVLISVLSPLYTNFFVHIRFSFTSATQQQSVGA